MTLADFAEREAYRMRAELAERDPEDGSARYVDRRMASISPEMYELLRIRAMLSAYDKRPPCPLTPVVLELVSDIAGVNVDCGWHMVALAYQITVRRVVGDRVYVAKRLLSGIGIGEAHCASVIWMRETVAIIDGALRSIDLEPLTSDQTAVIGRCISEQAKVQVAAREATAP